MYRVSLGQMERDTMTRAATYWMIETEAGVEVEDPSVLTSGLLIREVVEAGQVLAFLLRDRFEVLKVHRAVSVVADGLREL